MHGRMRKGPMDPLELKVLRLRHGLRQYQVAAGVGIAPCRLSEIEAGRRQPPPEVLERILKFIEENSDA